MNTAYLEKALQLAEAGRDPVEAMRNQEKVVSLLRRARAEQLAAAAAPAADDRVGRVLERLERLAAASAQPLADIGASQILRIEDAPALAPGDVSQQLKVEWPGGAGFCAGLFAMTLDGDDTNLARVSVRITVNGNEDFFTTGTAATFVPLRVLHPQTQAWFRVKGPNGEEAGYPVTALTKWSVTFRYEGTGGPPTITPALLFAYSRK